MNRRIISTFLMMCCAAGAARATEADPSAPIAPFVNYFTFAVARVEPGAIDFDALRRWGDQALGQANVNAEDLRITREGLKDAVTSARKWTADFTRAGGKSLWIVFTLETFPQDPAFLVIPLEKGSDGQALLKLMGGQARAMQLRGAIVSTLEPRDLPSVRAIAPQSRPELEKALASCNDAKACVAVIPSDDARRVIESMVPTLPNGQATDALTAGVLWAAANVNPPPGASIQTLIQAKDAQSANQISKLLVALIPADQKSEPLGKLFAELTRGAQVKGDRVVIPVNPQQASVAAAQFAYFLHRARVQANREISASHMRQILYYANLFGNSHFDKKTNFHPFPDNLEQLVKDQQMPPQLLVNPSNPGEKIGYAYIQPHDGFAADQARVVLYEKYKPSDFGINLGFGDGHVEFWPLKTAEEQIRKAQAKANAK